MQFMYIIILDNSLKNYNCTISLKKNTIPLYPQTLLIGKDNAKRVTANKCLK